MTRDVIWWSIVRGKMTRRSCGETYFLGLLWDSPTGMIGRPMGNPDIQNRK